MKIDQIIDEFNHLEQKDKAAYIANLQKKADNGDMSALFLTGYLQIPPDWEVIEKGYFCRGSGTLLCLYLCQNCRFWDFSGKRQGNSSALLSWTQDELCSDTESACHYLSLRDRL